MGKPAKVYRVGNLTKVDTTKYEDGDIFITNRSIGILANGSIKTIPSNLNDYAKKSDVKKMMVRGDNNE